LYSDGYCYSSSTPASSDEMAAGLGEDLKEDFLNWRGGMPMPPPCNTSCRARWDIVAIAPPKKPKRHAIVEAMYSIVYLSFDVYGVIRL
jgi:hypothetical protein